MYNYDVDLLMMSRVNARNMYRSLINVFYVNKQEFSASSWRSNQGFFSWWGKKSATFDTDFFLLLNMA